MEFQCPAVAKRVPIESHPSGRLHSSPECGIFTPKRRLKGTVLWLLHNRLHAFVIQTQLHGSAALVFRGFVKPVPQGLYVHLRLK